MIVPEEPQPQSEPVKIEGLEIPLQMLPDQPEDSPAATESAEGLVPPDLPQNTPPQPEEMLQTECAFIVFKTAEGIWAADSNVGRPIAIGREATFHDMRHAAVDIIHGISIQETAQTVIMMQQQVAQGMMKQAAEQRAAAEISQRLGGIGGGIDLSGFKK